MSSESVGLEAIKSFLRDQAQRAKKRLRQARQEILSIKPLIFESRIPAMVSKIFQAIEAALRAATYLLIVIMGLSITGLGAFTILFLAIRIGQFLYTLIFKDKWL